MNDLICLQAKQSLGANWVRGDTFELMPAYLAGLKQPKNGSDNVRNNTRGIQTARTIIIDPFRKEC